MYFRSFRAKICDRGEDAPGNDIALDFGKPQLHLVQPGGIGRREVEPPFGFCSRNSSTALVLWADRLSSTMWICFAHRAFFTNSRKKTINSALVCRFAVLPCTLPVFTSKAAYSDSVP